MTVPEHAAARAATAKHKDRILGLPGVTGIFTGEKRVGGAKTGQRSVVVTVAQKKPLSEIPAEHHIPATLDGIPTDVIEEVFRPCDDLTRYNPLKGGARISVTPEEDSSFSAGTAGMIVTDAGTGDPMILSCWHVLYGAGLGSAGDIVVNPPYAGGDPTHDKVGKTTRFALTSQVDAAVARVEGRAPSRTIIDIGKPTEIQAAAVDMAVRKRGATSGLTNGVVTSTDWSGMIDYGAPTGVVSFSNMIRFEGDPGMVLGGDSGSVLVAGGTGGGGGDGACIVPVWTVLYGDWATTDTSAAFTGHSTELCSVPGSPGAQFSGYAWIGPDTYDGTGRVRVTGTVTMDVGVSDPSLFIGLHSTDESGASSGITVTLTEVDFFSWSGFDDDLVDVTGGFDFVLDWDPVTGNFNAAVRYSGGTILHTQSLGSWPASPRVVTIETNGNQCALGVTITDLCVSSPVDLFIVGDWVEITATFNSDLVSATAIGTSGYGSDHGHPIDNAADWTIGGTFDPSSGGAGSNIFFGVGDGSGVPAYQATIYVFAGSTAIDLDTRNVSDSLPGSTFSDMTSMAVELSWTQATSTLAVTVTQGVRVETFSIVDPDPTDITGPYYPFFGIGGNAFCQAVLTDYEVTP